MEAKLRELEQRIQALEMRGTKSSSVAPIGLTVDSSGVIQNYPKIGYEWGRPEELPVLYPFAAGSLAPNGNYRLMGRFTWNGQGDLHIEIELSGFVTVANSTGTFGFKFVKFGDPVPAAGSNPHLQTTMFRNAANQHAMFPTARRVLEADDWQSIISPSELVDVYACAYQGSASFDVLDVTSMRTILLQESN